MKDYKKSQAGEANPHKAPSAVASISQGDVDAETVKTGSTKNDSAHTPANSGVKNKDAQGPRNEHEGMGTF